MHLASLYKSNRNEYDRLIAKIITDATEYRYLVYFTSAQQKEIGLDIASHLTAGKRQRRHDDDFVVDVAYESQDETVAKFVADRLSSKSRKTLKITRMMQAHTVSGHIFIMNHREVIETLDISSDYLRERPDASRDLAQFICKMPHLKNLTLNRKYGVFLHDDFFSTSSSMASSTKIETLDISSDYLRERPNASRDLAQFICKMPHLKNLTLNRKYGVFLHDDFFSTSSSMASSAKIETLNIKSQDLSGRPSASRDLAQFICKMSHLKNLTLRGQYHNEFYSTSSSSMAAFALT
eukprot:XP_011665795.1 PREDICTED: uncharacterized protein LOC105439017 [Strongylocentrotus purpuratus]